jgi:predicted anti-sigma-YlaC factor YlaD
MESIINLYFDGELDKNNEAFLFSELSRNEECRDYFRQVNRFKNMIQVTNDEFPPELDRRILNSVKSTKPKIEFRRSIFPVLSYSLTIIMLIVSLFLFMEVREYRSEIQKTSERLLEQQKTINLLINSLPPVEVETELKNTVIIRANL